MTIEGQEVDTNRRQDAIQKIVAGAAKEKRCCQTTSWETLSLIGSRESHYMGRGESEEIFGDARDLEGKDLWAT